MSARVGSLIRYNIYEQTVIPTYYHMKCTRAEEKKQSVRIFPPKNVGDDIWVTFFFYEGIYNLILKFFECRLSIFLSSF